MNYIDLRSDTVTQPTSEMREAMAKAPVGDDVFGDDPTINQLQELAAAKVGKQAGLFIPSGTMGNLSAILSHCTRGDEAIMGKRSHTFLFEGGGISTLGGIHSSQITEQADGSLPLDEVEANLRDTYDADGTPPDSELADEQRRLLICDQMAVFRSKPFIAGAVFWTYQDYRTRSTFVMGVVDPERKKRPSWDVLREEFSPVLIDSLTLSPVVDERRMALITLHTRGPIDVDMPVYTLRSYALQWAVTSPDGSTEFSEGDVSLPTLLPASQWSGEIPFTVPAEDYIVTVSIIRPTGFNVIERSIDEKGELVQ